MEIDAPVLMGRLVAWRRAKAAYADAVVRDPDEHLLMTQEAANSLDDANADLIEWVDANLNWRAVW